MAEHLPTEIAKRIAADYGLTVKSPEKPAPVEYASGEERRKFFALFCNRNKQGSDRVENIRNASARYALETVTGSDQRHELALLAIDTNEELEKLSNDLVDGRASKLTKADYDKYVGALERAEPLVTTPEITLEVFDESLSPEEVNQLAEYASGILFDGEVIVEQDNSGMDGYFEQRRLSDPTQAPSRSRRIGRLSSWIARRGGSHA